MTDETKAILAGGYINCALFLAGVFSASLVVGNHIATALAILSCGLAVLHYDAQMGDQPRPAFVLHLASNAAAVVGAVILLWGYWF